jgi:hypothetical protein
MQINEAGKTYTISVKENGDKFWYYKGKLHREQGPAIELNNNSTAWYFEGEKIKCSSQQEFDKAIAIKKQAATKKYWDVRVECTLPATLNYRIFAASPEEAVALVNSSQPTQVKYKLIGKKSLKATVYDAGCSVIKLVKNLLK